MAGLLMKDSLSSPSMRQGAKAHVVVPSLNLPAKESTKPERGDHKITRSPPSDESQATSLPNSARSMTDSSGIPSARSAMSINSGRGAVDGRVGGETMASRICQSARRPGESPVVAPTKSRHLDVHQEIEHWKARCIRLQKQLEESPDIRIARLEAENRALREKIKRSQEMNEHMRMRDHTYRDRLLEAEERNRDLQLQLTKTERLVRELRNQQSQRSRGTPLSSGTPRDMLSPRDHPLSGKSTPRGVLTPREIISPGRGNSSFTPRSINTTPRDHYLGSGSSASRTMPISPRDGAVGADDLRRKVSANAYVNRQKIMRDKGGKGVHSRTSSRGGSASTQTQDDETEVDLTLLEPQYDSEKLRPSEGCAICRANRRVSFSSADGVRREKVEDDPLAHDNGYLSDAATLSELKEVLKGIQHLVSANRHQKVKMPAISMPHTTEPHQPKAQILLTCAEDTHIDHGSSLD